MPWEIVIVIVQQILVDTGSFTDIITLACLKEFKYYEQNLEAIKSTIARLDGYATYLLGTKKMPIQGDNCSSRIVKANFLVVDILVVYYVILWHPTLSVTKVMALPYYSHNSSWMMAR